MWPEVFVLIEKKIKEYEAKKNKLFILDAAMIFEGNFEHMLDATLLISSKKEFHKGGPSTVPWYTMSAKAISSENSPPTTICAER